MSARSARRRRSKAASTSSPSGRRREGSNNGQGSEGIGRLHDGHRPLGAAGAGRGGRRLVLLRRDREGRGAADPLQGRIQEDGRAEAGGRGVPAAEQRKGGG